MSDVNRNRGPRSAISINRIMNILAPPIPATHQILHALNFDSEAVINFELLGGIQFFSLGKEQLNIGLIKMLHMQITAGLEILARQLNANTAMRVKFRGAQFHDSLKNFGQNNHGVEIIQLCQKIFDFDLVLLLSKLK